MAAAKKEYNNQVVEKFLNKNYYNPEYMYNTDGPEVLRLYNSKDNTQHFTFTDVLDSVYYNVPHLKHSGSHLNTTIRCSSVHSSMHSSLSGPSITHMRRVLYHQNSEVNML